MTPDNEEIASFRVCFNRGKGGEGVAPRVSRLENRSAAKNCLIFRTPVRLFRVIKGFTKRLRYRIPGGKKARNLLDRGRFRRCVLVPIKSRPPDILRFRAKFHNLKSAGNGANSLRKMAKSRQTFPVRHRLSQFLQILPPFAIADGNDRSPRPEQQADRRSEREIRYVRATPPPLYTGATKLHLQKASAEKQKMKIGAAADGDRGYFKESPFVEIPNAVFRNISPSKQKSGRKKERTEVEGKTRTEFSSQARFYESQKTPPVPRHSLRLNSPVEKKV